MTRQRKMEPPSDFDGHPVLAEVAGWPGISIRPGLRGETSVQLGRVEIGHMHGARVAHFGFPKSLWAELLREGMIEPHPVDRPGWAARVIRTEEDSAEVVELFRLNYERLRGRAGLDDAG